MSRGDRDRLEPRQKLGWQTGTPGEATGLFKGARAFRSPCLAGIPRRSVVYRETRDAQSGEVLEALYPRSHGISVETAKRRLESASDIEVLVHHDHCGTEFAPPRVVKWADLEATDDESEHCLLCCGPCDWAR